MSVYDTGEDVVDGAVGQDADQVGGRPRAPLIGEPLEVPHDFLAGLGQCVLVDVGGRSYALACDHLIGKREIVIPSLGKLLAAVPC